MPSWCDTELTVYGSERELRVFLAFARSWERCFDFDHFIPYPEEYAERDRVSDEWQDAHAMNVWRSCPPDGYNRGGKEWCVENWGTEWNSHRSVSKGISLMGGVKTAVISFDTAWTPPGPVILSASERFPSLVFELAWREPGMRSLGRYICQDGQVLENTLDGFGPHGAVSFRVWKAIALTVRVARRCARWLGGRTRTALD